MDCSFYMPVRMLSGEGCVGAHPEVFQQLGRRCLIVTGRSGAKRSGALDDLTVLLDAAGIRWTVFDQITQNPLLSDCKRCGQAAREFGADFLAGIGGGSPLDATKAAAVFAANDSPPWRFTSAAGPTAPCPLSSSAPPPEPAAKLPPLLS